MYSKEEIRELLQNYKELDSRELNNIFYSSVDYDDNLEISMDDMDSEYYESLYGKICDLTDADNIQNEEYDFADDDIYSDIDIFTKDDETPLVLQQARVYRAQRQYTKAMDICKKVLMDENEKEYIKCYALNMRIALLKDMDNLNAYNLCIFCMKNKYLIDFLNNHPLLRRSFGNVLFGLLGKAKEYSEDFLYLVDKNFSDILHEYFFNLGENNPKRDIIMDLWKSKKRE